MHRRSVLLVFNLQFALSRQIWRGVLAHARKKRDWLLHFGYPGWMGGVGSIQDLRPDGVIALAPAEVLQTLKSFAQPIVNVTERRREPGWPHVTSDNVAVGRMAAEYFLERGFDRFGYLANGANDFSNLRQQGFTETIAAAGYTCSVCDMTQARRKPGETALTKRQVQQCEWLASLPRPAAVFACADLQAWRLAELCNLLSIRIPEELALLGVNNDSMFCESAHPPLSSVVLQPQNIGKAAAELLDRLMDGETAPKDPVLIPPLRVQTRQSTDVLAVADADVAAAVRFIGERADKPVRVGDILKKIPVSRRVLERKFRAALGRTPLDEVLRVHIERAKFLLSDTEMHISDVAVESGFQSHGRLSAVFRQKLGISPSEYRKSFGLPAVEDWRKS